MYKPFAQPEGGDNAIWDYVAQCIVRGQVPYRDVIEIKTPGSAYLSALAMLAGQATGLDSIASVRVFNILTVGVLGVVILLVARAYLSSLIAGFIAVLFMVAWPGIMEFMVAGTRPKVAMIIFGLITLLLIAYGKPFWSGFSSMLSVLCWQPGLLFTFAALLVFSQYLTTWRDRRVLKVLLGAAIPLAVVVIYFLAAGAFLDFWRWTVEYNYLVYFPEGREPAGAALTRLWDLINEVTNGDTVWANLGIIGFLIYAVEGVSRRRSGNTSARELFKDALVIVPFLFLIFKTINYPGSDDLLLLFPFFGLFAAYAFTAISRWLSGTRKARSSRVAAALVRWVSLLPIVVIASLVVFHGAHYRIAAGGTLQEQQIMARPLAGLLSSDDRIYVHGTLELLVLLKRANMNRYIFLDRGKDSYIDERTPGGFRGVIEEMKAQNPKVISISRIRNVKFRDELLTLVGEKYDHFPLEFAHNSVYVRRNE